MDRRNFLGAMLAACSAPAIVRAESLMQIVVPKQELILPSSSGFSLSWPTAEDSVSLAGYECSVDDGESWNYADPESRVLTGLKPGRSYNVLIRAYDSQGNRSVPQQSPQRTQPPVKRQPSALFKSLMTIRAA